MNDQLKHGNCSECQRLWKENENLRAIIRKELSENDEFGAEYVHVSILRRENEELREKLKVALKALDEIDKGCSRHDTTAWNIANDALDEISRIG
jgi:hypothetical protein